MKESLHTAMRTQCSQRLNYIIKGNKFLEQVRPTTKEPVEMRHSLILLVAPNEIWVAELFFVFLTSQSLYDASACHETLPWFHSGVMPRRSGTCPTGLKVLLVMGALRLEHLNRESVTTERGNAR